MLIPSASYWEEDSTYAEAFAPKCWGVRLHEGLELPKEFRLDRLPSKPPPPVYGTWATTQCPKRGTVSQHLNLYWVPGRAPDAVRLASFIGGKPKYANAWLSSSEMAGYTVYYFIVARRGGKAAFPNRRVETVGHLRRLAALSAWTPFPQGPREPYRRCRHTWTVLGGKRVGRTFEGFLASALRRS